MKTDRRQLKRLLISCFAMLISLLASSQSINEYEPEGGTCGASGDNLQWTFYPTTGTLEIVGSGAMADYGCKRTPWDYLHDSICHVELSPDITHIGEYAFYDCNVSEFDFPEGVQSIGLRAFDCTPWMDKQAFGPVYLGNWLITCKTVDAAPATFVIEEGTIGVAGHAVGIRGVKEIIFPKGLKYIGKFAFGGLPDLTTISFSEGLQEIGEVAFADCDKLLQVTLPEGIERIGYGAFSSCKTLESVVLPSSLTSTGESSFASCPKLESVILSEGINRIDTGTFLNCSSLTEMTLPKSITSIGQSAFSGTNIAEIVLPENVEKIETAAFYGCPQLTKVTSLNRIPPKIDMTLSVFDTYNYDIDLFVPCRAAKDYERKWNGFASITELECECEKFKVTFIVEEQVVATSEFSHDTAIVLPEMKEVEGYTFAWKDVPDKMPTEDITIYGEYIPNRYLLTFKIEDEVIACDSVEYGTIIVVPELHAKEGYTFSGWDEVPETMPANDVTITGTFTINQYVIIYVIEGEVFATDTINYGESITTPEVPAREGYTFAWIDEIPETMPAKGVVINGAYTIIADVSHIVTKDEILYIYTLDGQRANKLSQGLNIVLTKDGSIRKIFVK